MCVVPIWVGHTNSNKMIKTYAMLDSCSQGSFIKGDLIADIGIKGRKSKLNVKTLTGETSKDSVMIDGLIISGINSKTSKPMQWIEVKRAYSQQTLPVEKEEIATPDKIAKWDYLKPIMEELTPQDNIDVGMLIGANCMKALEPLEIISSRSGGPYAFRTKLGWCIVGPIMKK